MIEGRANEPVGEFVARLAARARRLGEARALARTLERRDAPQRWRRAAVLWPLFVKD